VLFTLLIRDNRRHLGLDHLGVRSEV